MNDIDFIIKNKDCDLKTVLEDINLSSTPIYFELQFLSSDFVNKLDAIAKDNNASFYVLTDIIGNLAKTGNWFSNLNDDHKQLEAIVATSNLESVLSVDLSLYQNAGAHSVQQLAYSLAQANEYLNHFNGNIGNHIIFKVSTGGNYFFEIAKLRALRLLFKTLILEYNINAKCHIIALPSKRNKTLYDYNTNMLRSTTECMSAILGGANTVNNLAYDAIYHKDNEFGSRIARNQLLILKHESYFNAVSNASEGTYYIESLTQQFAQKALDLFKTIEAKGGFVTQLFEGTIQRKIIESAKKEQHLFDTGEEVLLGTNKHPNPNNKMQNEIELYPFVKTNIRKNSSF